MLVYVDEQLYEPQTGSDGTVGELIEEVRQEYAGQNRLVVGIAADGTEITGDQYQDTLQSKAEEFARYDFSTADTHKLVNSALSTCQELLDEAEPQREECIELLTQGSHDQALEVLGECCRNWQTAHKGICNSIGLLAFDPREIRLTAANLADSLGGAKEHLLRIRQALEAHDFVTASDVLEYEFAEVVENWRGVIGTIRTALQEQEAAG